MSPNYFYQLVKPVEVHADHSLKMKDLPSQIVNLPTPTPLQMAITYAGRTKNEPDRGMELVNHLSFGTEAGAHATVMAEHRTEIKRRRKRNKGPREFEPKDDSNVIL